MKTTKDMKVRQGQCFVILSATSAMAQAMAHHLASQGSNLILIARNLSELEKIQADLMIRYQVQVSILNIDLQVYSKQVNQFLLEQCINLSHSKLSGLIIFSGLMLDESLVQMDSESAIQVLNINYSHLILLIDSFAQYFKNNNKGLIVGVSSVAGDRGRQSNYHYGSAKGAFTLYLQGLRNYLYEYGVPVLTVKPGFVDTKMTYGLDGLFLVASAQNLASDIEKAMRKKKDVIYSPWFWRYIMFIIKSIPEKVFKKLKL